MQNFSHLVQGKHFQIREFNEVENWPYLGSGERYGPGYY